MMKMILSILFCLLFNLNSYADCIASYYADSFNNKKTATGTIFSNAKLTAASLRYKLNSKVRVTYKNKSIIVKITDLGGNGCLDLSQAAFKSLAPLNKGLITVKVQLLK